MTSKARCVKTVRHGDGNYSWSEPCKSAGPFMERLGVWYCRQHDPVVREAKWQAQVQADNEARAKANAAFTLRQRHERIGRLVVEHKEALECYKDVACLPFEAPTLKVALEAILKEVES